MTTDELDVFVSYSHDDDEKWVGRIRVHLARLIREGRVDLWDDTRIKAGDRWREEIRAALARAKVAVLLISADFYASDFIARHELPPLLEAERERGLVILGVHINYSSFDSDRTLSEYQTINRPGEPLESLPTKAEREKVFDQLRRRVEELLAANP
jgi:TIR domain